MLYMSVYCVSWRLCIDVGTSVEQEQVSTEDSSSTYSVSEPATKKKKVKRVSWVDESKLCSYYYFQLDETERGQCHCVSSITSSTVLITLHYTWTTLLLVDNCSVILDHFVYSCVN